MAGEVENLSGKLGLDTTDFKTAIAAANRELRVLETGFKASASALGDWTKDATGLESRVKTLTSQIDIQKAKVAALAAEQKRLADENGATSRAAQDAEIKLNKETETLNKMQNELGDTESALQGMKEGEQDASNAADDLDNNVQEAGETVNGFEGILGSVGSIAAGVVTVLAAIGAAAGAAVAGISKLVFSAADAAGEIQDMSDKTGISTTRLQELGFIGKQTGTDLDTITGSQSKLIRSMATASSAVDDYNQKLLDAKAAHKDVQKVQEELDKNLNPTLEAFNELGIAVRDSNGNLRDNQTVFSEVIDALGRVQNPVERDAIAMQIFGKSAQELNPLIKLGSSGMAQMADQAHKLGAVMSEENVAALDDFGDKVQGLKDGLHGTAGTLASAFLPVFSKLTDVFLEKINPAIQSFIKLAMERLAPVISTIVDVIDKFSQGDIRGGLAEFLGADNASEILNIANLVSDFLKNTLIPFFTQHAGKIGSGASSIVAVILKIIEAIVRLSIFWAQVWIKIDEVLFAVWGVVQPIFAALFNWLSANIPQALQTLSGFWTTTLLPAIQVVWSFLSENVFPLLRDLAQFIIAVFIADLKSLAAVWQNIVLPALQRVWAFLNGSIFPLLKAIGNFISAVFNVVLKVMAGIWQNFILPALQKVYGYLANNIFPIFQTVANYISTTFQPILNGLASFLNTVLAPAWNGIVTAISKVVDWLNQMADKLDNLKLPDWLTPGSPTPWEIGLVGINKAMEELNKQLPQMALNLNQVSWAGAQPGPGSPQRITNNQNENFNLYGPVIMQGSTPAGSLAARLKGRRY